jgi:Hypoxia induced protein conserved region.
MTLSGNTIVLVAVIAVACVLILRLVNMLRGGSPSRSQNLMRWRVILQFLAIVIIMLVIWWRSTS